MTQSNNNDWWFGPLFRVGGYGLLVLALLDIVDIFVPPRFIDPNWIFQMIKNLVERAPVALLGLVLVFAGEKSFRIFKFLSWATFVLGVLFLLVVPLGIASTVGIDRQNNLQTNTQVTEKTARIQQIKNQLSKSSTTAQDLDNILIPFNTRNSSSEINNSQRVKSQLLLEIAQAEQSLHAEAEAKKASSRLLLIKSALKWNLGALVCGVVFLSIWRQTYKVLKASRQRVRY